MIEKRRNMFFNSAGVFLILLLVASPGILLTQQENEEYESITSNLCVDCHDKSKTDTMIVEDLAGSIHDGFDCQDCHQDKGTMPHKTDPNFTVISDSCKGCHTDAAEEYTTHGQESVDDDPEAPTCVSCHGGHNILPSDDEASMTHPSTVPRTCSNCHENINLTTKYDFLINHPIEIFDTSVHGIATKGGSKEAASCRDCHSTGGSSHKILSPGNSNSTINHFNIPKTCGQCHESEEKEFWEGIHGILVKRGETDSPVCTHCHGEHGIIPPGDPRSRVSSIRLAESTCTPCHESAALSEKYGFRTRRSETYIDSYHGLKTKAGDTTVANCASCHGVHKILPSSNPESTIHTNNIQTTCGECHPGITSTLAHAPIHGEGETGLETKAARVVRTVYILAIIVIIGMMALHWLIDIFRQIIQVMKKPQVRRMRNDELIQHTLLMVSFIVLVISGFSLRSNNSFFTRLFFGWEGGFEWRGIIHRIAAVVLIISTVWHSFYLLTRRGQRFFSDMFPKPKDFIQFFQRTFYNLGLSKKEPKFERFSYVEKAEYWALIWGNVVMILTGLILWFDNFFIQFLPKGILDVSLVVHYYEAILASLAILIWHLYSTVFNPQVYPMNPSWLTGKMPETMFRHEHGAVKEEDIERD
ncbi:MAG: cytochrome c3 family protein [Candidatus Aminicenantes bacterium]|nr:cytochrome c3 family protein [Candidatus Aminicenantes bacterium]